MAFKTIIALTLFAVVNAGVLQPILTKSVEEYDPHPQYTYSYGVHDAHTGDSKSHIESRDEDIVHGEYQLNDADGYRRIVRYTADPINGFNAVVHREPILKAVVAAASPVYKAAPVALASPVVVKTAYAPAAYSTQSVVNHVPVAYRAPFYAYHH